MAIFKCKMCGGALEVHEGESVCTCEYCGTKQTLPKLIDDKKANMYDRANHFRRNNEYDKAIGIYEQILNEDNTDAESYWSLVLCKYGIEYVEDPATKKRIPTINRAQFTSVFTDEDYKSALKYADVSQREIYEQEAKAIDEIQKGILEISQKEEPFDVFICYKETDNNGRRTPDSVLANELYHQLIQEGFKVFFSRITLEDKLGIAYEPYIFAALNSAKVMVVLGTKPEHFNAVWVKNEWSRYLALIKNGAEKMLIPAYKDMDPYNLPEEFSHLQSQDMSKLGFMQDLIRGIKKIVKIDEPKTEPEETAAVASASVNSLLKRAFMFLEDGDDSNGSKYFERILDQDPENAQAYLGKMMLSLKVSKREDLKNLSEPFDEGNRFYEKVMRFADDALRDEINGYITFIKERNENERIESIYHEAISLYSENTIRGLECAVTEFTRVIEYKDSAEYIEKCKNRIEELKERIIENQYVEACEDLDKKNYQWAIGAFERIIDYKDSKQKWEQAKLLQKEKEEQEELERKKLKKRKKRKIFIMFFVGAFCIASGIFYIYYFKPYMEDKKALESEIARNSVEAVFILEEKSLSPWENNTERKSISVGGRGGVYDAWGELYLIGLTQNKTVVIADKIESRSYGVKKWEDIVAIDAGVNHTIGLKQDGTVLAVGDNNKGQCNVEDWQNIVAISAGHNHTVGLMRSGMVQAVGDNNDGRCNVENWEDIVAISAGACHTVGLKSDGTVLAVGDNNKGQCNVEDWQNIVAISAGDYYTIGLKEDGTVIAAGTNDFGRCNIEEWKDIVAISAGKNHTAGLKKDGTVVVTESNQAGQCNVEDWKNIIAVSVGYKSIVGLKSDGSVVVAGDRISSECDVSDWNNIKIPNNVREE